MKAHADHGAQVAGERLALYRAIEGGLLDDVVERARAYPYRQRRGHAAEALEAAERFLGRPIDRSDQTGMQKRAARTVGLTAKVADALGLIRQALDARTSPRYL